MDNRGGEFPSSTKHEREDDEAVQTAEDTSPKARQKSRKKAADEDGKKRRCISSACVPCRKRKSKCDGNTPSCSACAAVYDTECRYDPASDHRRKGVYKRDIDNLKTRNSTLQTLIQAILNYPEEEVAPLVQQIRTCESLDAVAEAIMAKESGLDEEDEDLDESSPASVVGPTFESHLSGKMGEMYLDDGSMRFIGGTSVLLNIIDRDTNDSTGDVQYYRHYKTGEDWLTSWTMVTRDEDLIRHLLQMYFTWHYTFFTTLSRKLFERDFRQGNPPSASSRQPQYCSPLLVNAMLALGCHFTSMPGARAVKDDSATAGDHFFKEAKRLILEGDLHEKPRLATVQALALMSVREAGCGREAKGWVYSGMSFRMACDLGLNLDSGSINPSRQADEDEDARRITFWGCFLFDKCWSNYLGRLPQLPKSIITVPKFEVFPDEDAATWSAFTDSGHSQAHAQPARVRAVALQVSALCDISADLLNYFYNPTDIDKVKGKQSELKKLSEIHQRLETWRRELPKELEPKEGGLPSMLVMHMFFQLLYIHLFRPFLKYTQATSPLPAHVSPRKLCTQAAATISKLLRLYKRSHGLRQICNIAVYIAHSACTIHLLNLPDKIAKRDIVHGVKHLEEIAEGWLCARRTLGILNVLARKWDVDLPEEAAAVLQRAESKFGAYGGNSSSAASSPQTLEQDYQPAPPLAQTSPTHVGYQMAMQQPQIAQIYSNAGSTTYPTQMYSNHQSSQNSLPPNNASDLAFPRAPTRFQVSTPATMASDYKANSAPGTTAGDSPSALGFGGIEQLLRDGQNWAYQDQVQLATGFDNWAGMPEAELTQVYAQTTAPPQHNTQTASPAVYNNMGGINPGAQMNGGGPVHSMNGVVAGLTNITGFSEDETSWYQ